MTLYAPIYDHGRGCLTIEHAEELRPIYRGAVARIGHVVGYSLPTFCGPILRVDALFYTAEAVRRYWAREPINEVDRCRLWV